MEPTADEPDRQRIELREGMHIALAPPGYWEPWVPLLTAWSASVLLGGKPVLLTGWPGSACVSISSKLQLHPGLMHFMRAAWPCAEEAVLEWLHGPDHLPELTLPLPYSEARLARDIGRLSGAALRIDWCPTAGARNDGQTEGRRPGAGASD